MSNRRRRRVHRSRRSETTVLRPSQAFGDPPPVAKLRSPADALAMVPYLLGFEPHESLVIVSLVGSRRRFGPIVRGDLVDPDQAGTLVDYLANATEAKHFDTVLVIAYTTRRDAADSTVTALVDALERRGIDVHEALRADGSRWWSYTCDRGCCSVEGTPYDPSTTAAAALAVSLGMAKASSRSALADQFAQRDDDVRAAANAAARVAVVTLRVGEGRDSVSVDDLVRSALASDPVGSPTLGRLLGAVQDLLARDVAWVLMTRDDADRHYELWRQVMIMADDDLMAPAGTLCAFAAWLSGRGALASTAAERVAQVRPDYPFLELIVDILVSGMSPDRWEAYRRSVVEISAEGRPAGAVAGDAAG